MHFLKLAVMSLAMSASLAANAQTKGGSDIGSAFVNRNTLYVTVLGDGCNAMGGRLEVEPLCSNERLTQNFVTECSAELFIISTAIACPAQTKRIAQVLEIDLKESKVDREAQLLNLNVMGQTIQVRLK